MGKDFTETADYEDALNALKKFNEDLQNYSSEIRRHIYELFSEAQEMYTELINRNEEEKIDEELLLQIKSLFNQCMDGSERLQHSIDALADSDQIEQTDKSIQKLIDAIENYRQIHVG